MIHDTAPEMRVLTSPSGTITPREIVYRAWHEGARNDRHFMHVTYYSNGVHALASIIAYHPRFADCDAAVMFASIRPSGLDWRTVDSIPADEWVDAVALGSLFQYAPPTRVEELAQELYRKGTAYLGMAYLGTPV